jgi:hypothetical protein
MVWANPSIAKYFLTHFYVFSFIRLPWKSMVHSRKNPLLQANILFYLEDMEKIYYMFRRKLNQNLTISNKYNWLVSKWPNLLNNFVYFEDYKKWHSCLLPLAWWKPQIFSRLIRTLQQKVSLYAKCIHWILSEFTSCSERGPMKK